MIDIYALDKIKRITNYVYYNKNKFNKEDLYKKLMEIKDLVR